VGDKAEVWLGTLSLMVLKMLETMGPQHGYGIARRIEQTSGNLLALNYGTLYPALLKLEQEGAITSEWGVRTRTARQSSTDSRAPGGSNWSALLATGNRRLQL
jgi:DNA-binding PadR family transcriptional regulator